MAGIQELLENGNIKKVFFNLLFETYGRLSMYITTLITVYDWDPGSHSGRSLVGVGLGPI